MIGWIALCVTLFVAGVLLGDRLKKSDSAIKRQDKPPREPTRHVPYESPFSQVQRPRTEWPKKSTTGAIAAAREKRVMDVISQFDKTKDPELVCVKCGAMAEKMSFIPKTDIEAPYCEPCSSTRNKDIK